MYMPSHYVVRLRRLFGLCCLIGAMGLIGARVVLSRSDVTFQVDTAVDAVDINIGDGVCQTAQGNCSLRAAIQETNHLSGTDTIELPTGTYTLTIGGVNENQSAFGDLDITDDLIIQGADRETVIIDGNGQDRVLHTFATVTISAVTVQNGNSPDNLEGSGIRNEGSLTLDNVIVRKNGNNNEMADGQGVASIATLLIKNSLIEQNGGNFNSGRGGGVFSLTYETTTIEDTIIRNNSGSYGGGVAIYEKFGHLIIQNSQVTDNRAYYGAGGILVADAKATISDSTILRNEIEDSSTFGGSGGGIQGQSANMTIINSLIAENFAAIEYLGHGGGGIALISGFMSIQKSTIRNNQTGFNGDDGLVIDGFGGGVMTFSGSSRISQSAIYSNSSKSGGGVYNQGSTVIDNSTIGRNQAASLFPDNVSEGGGIYNTDAASLMLLNVTIAENQALNDGGGLWNSPTGSVVMHHSILGNNNAADGADCFSSAVITSLGYNLVEDASSCPLGNTTTGNILNQDPILGPLQDNGGPTNSYLPLNGSPAIDTGDPAGCNNNDFVDNSKSEMVFVTDQRSYTRIFDGDSNDSKICDIGSVEALSSELVLDKVIYLPAIIR